MLSARYAVAALVGLHAAWLAYIAVGMLAPAVGLSIRFKQFPPLEMLAAPLAISVLLITAAGLQLMAALRLGRQQDRVFAFWLTGVVVNAAGLIWLWFAAVAAREMLAETLVTIREMGIDTRDAEIPKPRHYLGLTYPLILTALVWWADRRRSA